MQAALCLFHRRIGLIAEDDLGALGHVAQLERIAQALHQHDAAAVALRHLQLIDEWRVLDNVRARADQLRALLGRDIAPLEVVAEVRQCGLMVGIELAPPVDDLRWGRKVSAACVRRGVLIRPLGPRLVMQEIVRVPVGVTASALIRSVCRLWVRDSTSLSKSHNFNVMSSEPDMARCPSDMTVMAVIEEAWPARLRQAGFDVRETGTVPAGFFMLAERKAPTP